MARGLGPIRVSQVSLQRQAVVRMAPGSPSARGCRPGLGPGGSYSRMTRIPQVRSVSLRLPVVSPAGGCAHSGVRLLGDMPFYVALDSADVWAQRDLFKVDAEGQPTFVAGVPPDYFSATGQRWGNPVFQWQRHEADGYQWWIQRLGFSLTLYDMVRIDHFRAFSSYWEIDACEPTAVNGQWTPGPGVHLFERLREVLGELPLVAEDLGLITSEVRDLKSHLGLPGMKVLQFGFDSPDSEHLPHNFSREHCCLHWDS